ncbi:MAG: BTAD domain-containing putative transcriptional regulator [Caldilineaceae bacterium]
METLHISLLGELQIQNGKPINIQLEALRAQELLCYLLLHRDQLHDREKLATLMWAEAPATRSKQYLRQTLWQVQSKLNPVTVQEPLLVVEHHRIGVNPRASFWLDVALFEETFAALEKTSARELTPTQMELLRSTVQLYHGDLLAGWYQDWCIYARDRYQNMYLSMLDKLLSYCELHHAYEAGLRYGWQILQYDRAREGTHRRLMRLHYQAGNRTAAIHQYELCVTTLAEELDVGPAHSTTALYEQICADCVVLSAQCEAAPADHPDQAPLQSVPILQQLEQMQLALSQLQAQVAALMRYAKQNDATVAD